MRLYRAEAGYRYPDKKRPSRRTGRAFTHQPGEETPT